MNVINLFDTTYLSPNKTIERVILSDKTFSKSVFVYNYKGVHFRLFLSKSQMVDFFDKGKEPRHSFNNEYDLDEMLKNLH